MIGRISNVNNCALSFAYSNLKSFVKVEVFCKWYVTFVKQNVILYYYVFLVAIFVEYTRHIQYLSSRAKMPPVILRLIALSQFE